MSPHPAGFLLFSLLSFSLDHQLKQQWDGRPFPGDSQHGLLPARKGDAGERARGAPHGSAGAVQSHRIVYLLTNRRNLPAG